MADTEFEQFRQSFERLPQHIKATARTYTLVHDLALDDDTDASSCSARSDSEEDGGPGGGGPGGGGPGGGGPGGGGPAGGGLACGEDEVQSRERRPPRLDGPPRSRFAWVGRPPGAAPAVGTTSDPVNNGDLADSLPLGRGSPVVPIGQGVGQGAGQGVGMAANPTGGPPRERRRRRLPEIPESAKKAAAALWNNNNNNNNIVNASGCAGCTGCRASASGTTGPLSLAAEFGALGLVLGTALGVSEPGDAPLFAPGGITRPLLVLKCAGLDRAPGSPDSLSAADTLDSGHSTMHSPKSMSPQLQHDSLSPNSGSAPGSSACSPTSSSVDGVGGGLGGGRLPLSQLELLEATHRGLYKFVPRHRDEIEVEIGDLIYVQKEADDLWCEGVNLRTGRQGCFPSAYAVDLEYTELDPSEPRVRRERFLMRYLGSVETQRHKGTAVLSAALSKILDKDGKPKGTYTPCVLEVSDKGLRMSDSGRGKRPGSGAQSPPLDYFYSLKHVSFCAYLPRDQRYLGFITKHPQLQRFACHVFLGQESTRPVAESVGRAFQRFYQKYVETAFPVEDIYID